MQRISQICCRLTTQIRGTFFLNHEGNSVLTTHVQNVMHQKRLKHTTGDESADKDQATSQFSGYIPIEELQFSYSRSSGPGGQHVNKVNTKVEMRFHVASASWLAEDIKSRLIEMENSRITKEGFLILKSDRTRKQILNQADVMDKLRTMVFRAAAAKPRGLTDEEIELRDKRLHKSKEHALKEKRHHSMKKQTRGSQGL
ncbi:large ribosomal subunit protein mL62-like [Babylonia areolata]|uniref:large ribosomal subunit protein mL62-like n=1 Tax=Babylonia areolata TaxID=304850 RepID=UPI003FCFF7AA